MLYVNPATTQGAASVNQEVKQRNALRELERLFAYMLLQEMRRTVPEDNLLGSGLATQMQSDMLDDALSGAIAESGQLGLAKLIEDQIQAAAVQRQIGRSLP
jgi:Rod binding domain-containing protein